MGEARINEIDQSFEYDILAEYKNYYRRMVSEKYLSVFKNVMVLGDGFISNVYVALVEVKEDGEVEEDGDILNSRKYQAER